MQRQCAILSVVFAVGLNLVCARARAADSVVAACLSASAASIQSDNQHQLRAERAQLLSCAAAGCPADVRKECIRRVDEVNAAIPSIVFEVEDAGGNDLSAVAISMDGEALVDRLDGLALSLDPGLHTFTFEAPGQPRVQKQLLIRQGQKDRHERITLGTPTKSASLAQPAARAPQAAPSTPDHNERSSALGGQKVLALTFAGLGLAGLGIGTVFGLDAISKRDDAEKTCPDVCADPRGAQRWHDAKIAGSRSTIAFVAGGALLAGAGVLWFSAGSEPASRRVELGLGLCTLAMRSQW